MDGLRDALRQHKPELIEMLTTLEHCPERSPFASLIEQARGGRLCLPEVPMSPCETVTNASAYVCWAAEEVRESRGHMLKCLVGLLRIQEAFGQVPRS
jgi:hypothetical protein